MSHEQMAEMFGLMLALCGGLAGFAYRDIRARLSGIEGNHRLFLTTLYHLATGIELPERVRGELERKMVNGNKDDS